MSLRYGDKVLRPTDLTLSSIGEGSDEHNLFMSFPDHSTLPTDDQFSPNMFFEQYKDDDPKSDYDKHLEYSLKQSAPSRRRSAVGSTDWSANFLTCLATKPHTRTNFQPSLWIGLRDDRLLDNIPSAGMLPSPVWNSAIQDIWASAELQNSHPTSSDTTEHSLPGASGQSANSWHQPILSSDSPLLSHTSRVAKYPTNFFDFQTAYVPWYFSAAAGYGSLSVPNRQLFDNLESLTTDQPLRVQETVQGSPSLQKLLRPSDDSRESFELRAMYNNFVGLCLDEHGSKLIGRKLETAHGDDIGRVFREIEPYVVQLMEDVHGHIVIQKLLDYIMLRQKMHLAQKMRGSIARLSLHIYASRVIGKAISYLLVDQQAELVKELEPEILGVLCHREGNVVVQEIIQAVPRVHTEFILESLLGKVAIIATHPYGGRVVQKLLDYGTDVEKAVILAELRASSEIPSHRHK